MSLSLIKKIKSEKLLRDNLKMTENWAECSTQLCKFFLCRPVMSVVQMDIFVFELAYVIYIRAGIKWKWSEVVLIKVNQHNQIVILDFVRN